MRVLVGVTGGIAAYKVAIVVRRLTEQGHDVRVIPTRASLEFVGQATWEALTGHKATPDTFEDVPDVAHVRLGQGADVILVAPATADFLAQLASGEARELLGNAVLSARGKIIVAPAMHTEMWANPATQANVATLRSRGIHVIEPDVGRLTGKDSGPGRLPEPEVLVSAVTSVAEEAPLSDTRPHWDDLHGLRVLVTAGGTREYLDPVRFLGNRSTGHQGCALAEAARERGADVHLIAANVALPSGEGVRRTDVETGAEFAAATREAAKEADVVIMAAAVADYRPAEPSATKLKKSGGELESLALVPTEDVLRGLVESRSPSHTIVGFAAETGDDAADAHAYAQSKAKRKGADLLCFNQVGSDQGFGDVPNAVTMFDSGGHHVGHAAGSKLAVAHAIWDQVVALRADAGV